MGEDYIPVEDWYDADWKVVDSEANYYEDMDYRHNPVNTFEGDTTFEVTLGGTKYKVNIMWTYFPDSPGRDLKNRITLHYFKVEDGDVPVYDDEADETVSLQDLIKSELFRVIHDYDLEYDMLKDTYPSDDYDGPDDYYDDYDDPRADYIYNPPMLRDPTPAEERPIKGSAFSRKHAQQTFTHEELLGADWKVVDCDYQDEYPPLGGGDPADAVPTHYSGETKIEATVQGQLISFVAEWVTEGTSKELKKHMRRRSKRRWPRAPAMRRWMEEHDEMEPPYPDAYYEEFTFWLEGVDQIQAPDSAPIQAPNSLYENVTDWVADYSSNIVMDVIPQSEVLCGLE